MPIDYEKLMGWRFEPIEHNYQDKDTILYALGVGFGTNVTDDNELGFLYEDNLVAMPSMASVLATPGFWLKDLETGVDWKQVLHGEQFLTVHKPLPTAGTVTGELRVTNLIDKGADKGAVLFLERTLHDNATGDLLCTLSATTMLRGDGGFGGPEGKVPKPASIPDREPDLVCDLPTLTQAAAIYRLCGDRNPLHIDPAVAAAAGPSRPRWSVSFAPALRSEPASAGSPLHAPPHAAPAPPRASTSSGAPPTATTSTPTGWRRCCERRAS